MRVKNIFLLSWNVHLIRESQCPCCNTCFGCLAIINNTFNTCCSRLLILFGSNNICCAVVRLSPPSSTYTPPSDHSHCQDRSRPGVFFSWRRSVFNSWARSNMFTFWWQIFSSFRCLYSLSPRFESNLAANFRTKFMVTAAIYSFVSLPRF